MDRSRHGSTMGQAYLAALLVVLTLCSLSCSAERGDSAVARERAGNAETVSLLGEPLVPPVLDDDVRVDREARLAEARDAWDRDPADADKIIWLGRRTAYLGRYRDAVEIFTAGMMSHPGDARLYRHRGHRYITLRRFSEAIDDLEQAAELVRGTEDRVEPDGLPNARNIPTSTLQSNIWYHLGLAYYLSGDLDRALPAYRECLAVSGNPDMLVATSHWLYMTLRRLGEQAEAARVLEPIHSGMEIIENKSYHRLLLLYRGELSAEELVAGAQEAMDNATVGYGVANWHFYNGRTEDAVQLWRSVLEGPQWAAFGYIAAEAELAR